MRSTVFYTILSNHHFGYIDSYVVCNAKLNEKSSSFHSDISLFIWRMLACITEYHYKIRLQNIIFIP